MGGIMGVNDIKMFQKLHKTTKDSNFFPNTI